MILVKQFYVNTTNGVDLIKVSHEVRQVVQSMKGDQGWVVVMAPSPGAGLVVMEATNEAGIHEGNLGLVRLLLPKSIIVPIEKKMMMMEPWQEIYLIDYETSGRRREFRVQLFSESEPKEANEPARQ